MLSRFFKAVAMVIIAVLAGIGLAYATTDAYFQGTGYTYYNKPADTYVTEYGVFMGNDTGQQSNTLRFWDGTDNIVMGDDDDIILMSNGRDVISLGGNAEDTNPDMITFDAPGTAVVGAWDSSTGSKVYVRCDDANSSTDATLTIRANDVVIQLND